MCVLESKLGASSRLPGCKTTKVYLYVIDNKLLIYKFSILLIRNLLITTAKETTIR